MKRSVVFVSYVLPASQIPNNVSSSLFRLSRAAKTREESERGVQRRGRAPIGAAATAAAGVRSRLAYASASGFINFLLSRAGEKFLILGTELISRETRNFTKEELGTLLLKSSSC